MHTPSCWLRGCGTRISPRTRVAIQLMQALVKLVRAALYTSSVEAPMAALDAEAVNLDPRLRDLIQQVRGFHHY